MGLFGTISRIIFCGLLLWSAYETLQTKDAHAKELVEKYDKFTHFVKNHTGVALPPKKVVNEHRDLVLQVFLGSEALTALAILFHIPYVGIFYAPYLLTSLLLEDNFLLEKGEERARLLRDFLVDLAILGVILMFSFPPRVPKKHHGKVEERSTGGDQKKVERSDSPKAKSKKAKRE